MNKQAGGGLNYSAAAIGAISLLSLAATNLITSATVGTIWLFGRQTHLGCWFKEKFHIPCPLCGLTRSVILSLHTDFGAAFQMHIAGPLAIFGILIFGAAMLYASLPVKSSVRLEQRIIIAAAAYFGIVTLISVVYWLFRISGYFSTLPELL